MVLERLEISPRRKPLAKAHALFYEDLKEVGGNKSKTKVVYGKIMINFFVGSAIAAKQEKAGMSKLGLLQQSLLILVKLFLQAIVKSS